MSDTNLEKAKLVFEILKSLVLGVFAIVTILAFTHPQSKVSITATNEAISRERAKLALEWLKEENTEKRALAFRLIDASYGKPTEGWLRDLEQELQAYSIRNALEPLSKRHRELAEQISKVESELQAEVHGLNSSVPGYGPKAYALKKQLYSLTTEFGSLGLEIQRSTEALDTLNKSMQPTANVSVD